MDVDIRGFIDRGKIVIKLGCFIGQFVHSVGGRGWSTGGGWGCNFITKGQRPGLTKLVLILLFFIYFNIQSFRIHTGIVLYCIVL